MHLFDFGFILIIVTIYVKDRVKLFLNTDLVEGDPNAKHIFYYFFKFYSVRTSCKLKFLQNVNSVGLGLFA